MTVFSSVTVTHSLKYFYTASSGIPNFPEFVTVGLVDGQLFSYYDSVIRKEIPKQDWIAQSEGPEYWERQTQRSIGSEQNFKANIDIVKSRFNQTGGVHVFQNMYGCEWDNETGEVTGYDQYGYDGEDFIAFNLKTETFIAPTPQAVITKHKWDGNKAVAAQRKNYLNQICPEWVKKYLNYGRSSLMRTVLPSVSLLQKTPSSPVSCHATGFYPNKAVMSWKKNGEELNEDVDQGEILPNHDGTFQMSIDLSSVKAEDWGNLTHSLKYVYTGSSQVPNFPEFVVTGLVDGAEMTYYDSVTGRAAPKQDWMNKVTADDPQYWEQQTQGFHGAQQAFKKNIDIAKQRFNQTEVSGVHIVQMMTGCEWDDETGEVTGFHQYGYDGEDFIAFDLRTETWIAPLQQAVITKHKWDYDRALSAQMKNYFTQICPEWLKKYVNYGRSSLMR
ncbi:hypothetical protein INR49_003448, partial [Caranx melampygus]